MGTQMGFCEIRVWIISTLATPWKAFVHTSYCMWDTLHLLQSKKRHHYFFCSPQSGLVYCVCVYLYICMHTHTHIYMCVPMYIYVHIRVHEFAQVYQKMTVNIQVFMVCRGFIVSLLFIHTETRWLLLPYGIVSVKFSMTTPITSRQI